MGLLDSAAGVGVSAATGNWIGAGISAVGLGMSLFGGMSSSRSAQEAAQIQAKITGLESNVNDQHEQAMQLDARRKSLEQIRLSQRAAAQATAVATMQGAQFGSGLQGGLGQITDQSTFNLQGINQNLAIGENIFGLDRQISSQKMALSKVQSNMASSQGLSSLGGSLMSAGPGIGRLSQGLGNPFSNSGGMFMGGGSPSGYGA